MEETKQVEFRIVVKQENNFDKVRVEISDAYYQHHKIDAPFGFWMCACEFLMHKVAQKSKKPYEDAMSLLVKGAMTYNEILKPPKH